MNFNFRSLRSGNYDSLLFAIVGFLIIQGMCQLGGIGMSPDSVVYASTATNLHDQGQLHDFSGTPVMDFPLGYPILLCGLMFLTGKTVLAFGPVWNGLLFGALIWVSGWLMDRFPDAGRETAVPGHASGNAAAPGRAWSIRLYKWAILACIVISPCLQEIYSMIWSETVFLLLSFFFFIACHRYFRTRSMPALMTMAAIAAVACEVRYAGVSLVALGGLLMLGDRELKWGPKKIGHGLLFAAISVSLLVLNVWRNHHVTGTLTGYREKGLTSFGENLHDFGSVLCDWLPFFGEQYGAATFIAIFFIGLIGGILVYRLVRRNNFFSYDTIALAYFIVYGGFILLTATVSRFQELDSRLLSPLFLPWLWGSTVWIPRAFRHSSFRWKLAGGVVAVVALGCFLKGEYKDWRFAWDGSHYAGIPGYTESQWQKSETMAYIRAHADSLRAAGPLYSNATEGIWLLAGGLKAELIAHKDIPEDIRDMMKDKHFTVIWFADADNSDLISIDYIRHVKQLAGELTFKDGVIYSFTTEYLASCYYSP